MGRGNLMVMQVSRNHHLFSIYWGNALLTIVCCGTFFILIFFGIAGQMLIKVDSWNFILLLAFSQLYFSRLFELIKQVFQTFEVLHLTAILNICFSIFSYINYLNMSG